MRHLPAGDIETHGDACGMGRVRPVLEILGELLPIAVGVLVSPVPNIGAILIAGSRRGAVKAPAYAVGWFVGVLILTLVLSLVGIGAGGTPIFVHWLNVILGLVLFWLARKEYLNRDRKELPPWMEAVDDLKSYQAGLAGLTLATIANPKSLPLSAAAGVVVAEARLGFTGTIIACVIFAAVGSLGMVLVAVLRFTSAGSAALGRLKEWLAENGPAITIPLFLVLGTLIITNSLEAIRGP